MKGIIGHIEFKDKILYQDKGLGCLVIQDVNYKTQLSLSMKSTLYGYGAGEFASCAGEIVYVNDGGFGGMVAVLLREFLVILFQEIIVFGVF